MFVRSQQWRLAAAALALSAPSGLVRAAPPSADAGGTALVLHPVPLDLHIELMTESIFQKIEPCLRQILASAIAQGAVERA